MTYPTRPTGRASADDVDPLSAALLRAPTCAGATTTPARRREY